MIIGVGGVGELCVESGVIRDFEDFTYVRLRYSTNFQLIPTLKFKHFLTPISTDMTSLLRKIHNKSPNAFAKGPNFGCVPLSLQFQTCT